MGGLVLGRGGLCGVAIMVAMDGGGGDCTDVWIGVTLQSTEAVAVAAAGFGVWFVAFSGRIACPNSH